MHRLPPVAMLVLTALALARPAAAGPQTLVYDSFRETKTVDTRLLADSPILMDGLVGDAAASVLDNTLLFIAGSASVSLAAGWLVAPAALRTVGVNIDLLSFDGTTVLASDGFAGVAGALARSTLSYSGLIAGAQYRLQITGTADQAARYQIDLRDGAVVPAFPATPAVAPTPGALTFDTHVGAKAQGPAIAPGGRLAIDGRMADDTLVSVVNSAAFLVTGGVLSAGVTWIVGAGPQRIVGVNVDLLDADNTVVASDSFKGITDGQAFSQFVATGLSPGIYTLLFTGTAPEGGRYHIDLSTELTPPGFTPIRDGTPGVPVPEAPSLALLLAGLAGLVAGATGRQAGGGTLRRLAGFGAAGGRAAAVIRTSVATQSASSHRSPSTSR